MGMVYVNVKQAWLAVDGKPTRIADLDLEYMGRGWRDSTGTRRVSPLGNPDEHPKFPGSTLPAYKAWLWEKMQNPDSKQAKEILRLAKRYAAGDTLYMACHCKDVSTCHTSVVMAAVKWQASKLAPKPAPATNIEWGDAISHFPAPLA